VKVVECLSSKLNALDLIPSTRKEGREGGRKERKKPQECQHSIPELLGALKEAGKFMKII
jgi:hypothetical protein